MAVKLTVIKLFKVETCNGISMKTVAIQKQLAKYKVALKVLSMHDM